MLRDFQLADFLTLGNGFAGMGAILATAKYLATGLPEKLMVAFVLLPVALLCDVLDGRVARWRHESSLLGQEMDSLADLVSFGVAPALVGFAMGMRGGWDELILVYFVGCGLSRLARYNATAAQISEQGGGKVRYFEGTPIPSSLLLVLGLFVLFRMGRMGDALPGGVVRLGPFAADAPALLGLIVTGGSYTISVTVVDPAAPEVPRFQGATGPFDTPGFANSVTVAVAPV